jgi:hypothetical protein
MPLTPAIVLPSVVRPARLGVAAAGILACLSLVAAQIRPLTLDELTSKATRVDLARVETVEVTRDPKGVPLTRIELTVESTWKGTPTNRITITQAGGTLGTRRVVVSGEAQYEPGEEVVVFLTPNSLGEWLTLEMAQGKFAIQRPNPTNAWVRNAVLGGSPSPGGFRPPHQLPLSLAELQRRVSVAKP